MIAAAALLLVLATPAQTTPGGKGPDEVRESVDSIWESGKPFLEAAGIDRRLFEQYSLWLELQYQLGYCRAHIGADDFVFWRTWWKNSVLERSDVGRRLLLTGDDLLNRGVSDGARDRPTLELCQRATDDWFAAMRDATGS